MSTLPSHAARFRDQDAKKDCNRRKNRHESVIKLRKEKNQENFAKRRNLIEEDDISLSSGSEGLREFDSESSLADIDLNNNCENKENNDIRVLAYQNNKTRETMEKYILEIQIQIEILEEMAMDPELYEIKLAKNIESCPKIRLANLFENIQLIRKMLSREKTPPINMVIQTGILSKIASLLNLDKFFDLENGGSSTLMLDFFHPEIHENEGVLTEHLTNPNYCFQKKLINVHNFINQIMFETAWILTNVCSGTSNQTVFVVNCDADCLENLVRLLDSDDRKIAEQCAWCLGNIAGDGAKLRDRCLNAGVIDPLLRLFQKEDLNESEMRNATWALGNLCRNKDPNPTALKYVVQLLPIINELLLCKDDQIVTDALWAISYITDGSNDRIQTVIDANLLPNLVSILDRCSLNPDKELTLMSPCIRSLGNIVTGNDEQTQACIDQGVLHPFQRILVNCNKVCIIKEICWCVSNVTAGKEAQIQSVLETDNLLESIIERLGGSEFRIQKEAIWVIANLTAGGNFDQLFQILTTTDVMKYIIELLNCNCHKTIVVIIETITNFLVHFEKEERAEEMSVAIEELGGLDILEKLQESKNEDVYKASYDLIASYFQDDEDGDIVNVLDNIAQNKETGEFEFRFDGDDGDDRKMKIESQGDQGFSF